MLSFHHSVLNEINSEPTGGLLLMSRGHFIHEFLSFYISNILRSPSVVAIFLNFPKEEAEYIVSNLSPWGKTRCKIIEAEATKKRSKIYCQGGVFFLTTRVFVIDILQLAVTPSMITHVVFYRADTAKTIYSRDVWAATMIKSENKNACILGLCESLDKVAIEKSLTRLMRFFYMKKSFFWPTCRFEVQRELNSVNDINQVECLLPLSEPQTKIQTILMKIIASSCNEIKRKHKMVIYERDELFTRSKRYLQVKAEKAYKNYPHLKRDSLIEDVLSLRNLLQELLTHDPIGFYKKLLTTQNEASESSVWYVNDNKTGNRIFQLRENAKERMYQLKKRDSPIEMSLRDFCETLKVRTGEGTTDKFRFLKESYSDDTLLLTKFKVTRDLHLGIESNTKLEQLKEILEELGREFDPKFPEQMKTLWIYASTDKQVEQIMSFLKNTFYKRDKNLFSVYNKLRNFLYWEQPTRMRLLKEFVKKKHTELSQAMEEENYVAHKDPAIDHPNFFVSDYSQDQMYQLRVEEAFLCECLYICLEVWLSTYKDAEKFLLNKQLETEIAGSRGPMDFNPTFTKKRGAFTDYQGNSGSYSKERFANEIVHNIDFTISLANPDDYDYSGNAVFPATRMIPGYKIIVNCLRVTTARHKFLFNENPHAIILFNPDPEILREGLLFKASEKTKLHSFNSSNQRSTTNGEDYAEDIEKDELVDKHIEVMIRESEKILEQRLPPVSQDALLGVLSTNYPTFRRKHVELFSPQTPPFTTTSSVTFMGHGLDENTSNGSLPYYVANQHYAKEDQNLLLDEAEREFLKKLNQKTDTEGENLEGNPNIQSAQMEVEEGFKIQNSYVPSSEFMNHLEGLKIPPKERKAALSSCYPIHHPSYKIHLERAHSLNTRIAEVNLKKLCVFMYKNSLESAIYMTHQKHESQSFEQLLREHETVDQNVEDPLCRVQKLVSENCNKEGDGPGRFIPPMILIDKREFNSNLPSRVFHEGFRAFPILLHSGDFIITNEICIERKAVDTGDLIDSIKSGRLDKQIQRMEENFKKW